MLVFLVRVSWLISDEFPVEQVNGNVAIQWQKPLDSWLADNGCSRQTCFLTATYKETTSEKLIAPDSYLFPSNFNGVTNLAKASVQVHDQFV